jgi:Na+-transporting methylmalonyl-CoA/oxaloacetate decarboxylase gamma subunit
MKGIRWLMVLPFLGILGGIQFANKVTPYVLGMPFILFWLVAWVIMTSIIMAIVYRFDPEVREEERT